MGNKVYFLKATELNQRLTQARKNDSVGSTTNGLVKPSCLIIDEMGRCKFDKENTRIFFDVIDRRASKEGPNCMIFTSNKSPSQWKEDFDEDDTLLCALCIVRKNGTAVPDRRHAVPLQWNAVKWL